ncbi:MAG: alpha/beta fold hydrolase [Acidimicrobiia bacterium]
MDRIEVGGVGIEYTWVGPRSGPVIVFLHEGLGCVTMWRRFPEAVAAASGLGVLVYSRWGYGRSDPRPLPWPVDHMEQEARQGLPSLLDALEVGDRVLWGHSDGATISLIHGGSHDDPQLRGIISVAAHVFGGETIGMESIEAARRSYASGDLADGLARHHTDPEGAFRGWADTWARLDSEDWTVERYLPSVGVPTLVVQGTADRYGTMGQVDAICGGIGTQARRLVLDGCGHHPHQEAPEVMVRQTVRFLDDLELAHGR